jgi:hypothetical protein
LAFTAILRTGDKTGNVVGALTVTDADGANNTTGNALMEVYALN